MFQFTLLWRVRTALADKEPGYSVTIKKNPVYMLKARVERDGTKIFYVHKLGTYNGHGQWYWVKYQLLDDGKSMKELRYGMYPSFFTDS